MNEKKSILEMARGGFMERVDYEMPGIIANLLDPNTKASTKRKLSISIEFVSDERDRNNIAIGFSVKPAYAPTIPVKTTLYVAGEDDEGVPQVVEMVPQMPGQVSMDGEEQEAPAMLKIINFS